MRLTKFVAIAAVALAFTAAIPQVASAKTAPVYTGTFSNVALSGYDAVAYFTQGKPVLGDKKFSMTYNGAEFRFANAEDLAKFRADPAHYAPQYGGYCAWAVSQGYTASADPKVWKIVNGKLYLNYSADIGVKWSKNIPGNIAAADGNWPKIIAK